ncbi:MAG: hypothetical protein U0694_04340 [Anaerolineae bacterium]
MLRYARLSVLIMLTFAVCSFVLTALGSTQPIHPALRGFVEGCEGMPQPCWYGIVPGVTRGTDAIANLTQRGFVKTSEYEEMFSRCSVYNGSVHVTLCVTNINEFVESDLVYRLSFGDFGARLEDILSAIGSPWRVFLSPNGSASLIYSFRMEVNLYAPSLALQNRISSIQLHMEDYGGPEFTWRGILPFWRYCQFEPQNELCP